MNIGKVKSSRNPPQVRSHFIAACGEHTGCCPSRDVHDLLVAGLLGHLNGVNDTHSVHGLSSILSTMKQREELVRKKRGWKGSNRKCTLFGHDRLGGIRSLDASEAWAVEEDLHLGYALRMHPGFFVKGERVQRES